MKVDFYEYSEKGGRSYNEDSLGSALTETGGVFVVADGLGGHTLGDEASACAVDTILSGWISDQTDISVRLKEKIAEANDNIMLLQEKYNAVMRTTVAGLVISGNSAVWANVGDSRVYFIHGNRLYAYTNDHSVAFKKYRAGEITREQICTDEDQSILLRSLGNPDRSEPDLYHNDVPLEPDDAFLLCSDGAWEYLKDEEIVIDFLKSETAEQWGELLLLRIMERVSGKHDNLSVLTVILK